MKMIADVNIRFLLQILNKTMMMPFIDMKQQRIMGAAASL